jgi:hypothetical protein
LIISKNCVILRVYSYLPELTSIYESLFFDGSQVVCELLFLWIRIIYFLEVLNE